ncbi:BREX system P-loop protein BrxC [Levilactobacillus namurensis]|uniref:BREX system P-loop protein BrxC n=1 Tax=Levilactobacillus namurensis TaxID=380393 RepID=A0AAW8W4I9_9LACO|nr:BREX system P-loop protein BrxC [Levilactobacillus namurensis]MDT7013339.1 BREX system P-loop protein BrxC [Levilactobacillus namurensis]
MKIKDIFAKSIDRDIKGVITIGDEQDANVKQELEEYVVTKELRTHFKDFFAAYANGINHETTKMGVWISGFFGSGKSHFLKILAYILENREVAGKRALDYFVDDQKISDAETLANMRLATTVPNEVMLFNIDSKAKNGNKSQKDAILNVFLQVFNEQLGLFGADFWIADMERDLIAQGKYTEFQAKFQELDRQHRDWKTARNAYAFLKGTIRNTLVAIDFMTPEDADGFIDQLRTEYPVSVESFAKLVNDYIESKGPNYHMAFLVDEVGQYIGGSQQRMLNLQSIVEDLGTYTRGKAWVIVTSQQAIDQVTDHLNGQDFSKIQGRFNTRIAMSSANVDEVIQKRLLAKTTASHHLLEETFNEHQHAINNLISFDGKEERKRYDDAQSFADLYPFVPYQIFLLQDTLTAIRENGSDGKHLANGERSMLAVFQESAQRMEDHDTRALIPFSLFFQGLSHFLDHTHMIVIQRAQSNELINPNNEEHPFAVQVLETLFMVKYVQDFDATLNNLVTLMIDSIDTDRIDLEKRVKDALRLLQEQNIVEKTTSGYEFLTDAEQDISKQIRKQTVDGSEVSQAIGNFLFSPTMISRRYTYPKLKQQYNFTFNQWVDDRPIGQINSGMGLKLVTPESEANRTDAVLRQLSSVPEQPQIIIDLPNDTQYVNDQQQILKIELFILNPKEQAKDARSQQIIDVKKMELNTLKERLAKELAEALQAADVYVQGEKFPASKKDFFTQLAQAQEQLVSEVYRNLSYIDVVKQENDVVALFKPDAELVATDENQQALQAVLGRVNFACSEGHTKVAYKTVLDRFKGIPYGYRELDMAWLVAKLFADSKLKVYVNGEQLNLRDHYSANEFANFFLKRKLISAVQLEPRQAISPLKKRALKNVAQEVFNKRVFSDDEDDILVNELQDRLQDEHRTLDLYLKQPTYYPGRNFLETGQRLIQALLAQNDPERFYDLIAQKEDDLLDWHEDMLEFGITEFYQNDTQQEIWRAAQNKMTIYENSVDFLVGTELKRVSGQIQKIMTSNRPEGKVQELKSLNEAFNAAYTQEFDTRLTEVQVFVQTEEKTAKRYSQEQSVADQYDENISREFATILNKAEQANSLNDLVINKQLAIARRQQVICDIDQTVDRLRREQQAQQRTKTVPVDQPTSDSTTNTVTPPATPAKSAPVAPKEVPVQALGIEQTWQLKDSGDVDAYVERLRQELLTKLKENGGKINFTL